MITVAGLIEALSHYPPDLRVFVRIDDDECGPQPVGDDMIVKRVDYDIPHIGGFYGNALVLRDDE